MRNKSITTVIVTIKEYKDIANDMRDDRLIQYHAKKKNYHKLPGVKKIELAAGPTRSRYRFTFDKEALLEIQEREAPTA